MPAETAILVLGHRRPAVLRNTLESLRRQRALLNTHVWLDGHQGFRELIDPVYACRSVAAAFDVADLVAYDGRVGIEKLMLDALSTMSERHARLIVLEDDCFPTSSAVEIFDAALDAIAPMENVFSVYGHHFLIPSEGVTIPRFQGWGWATTTAKLAPVLEQVRACYSWPEPRFRDWIRESVTPDVRARLEVTPGRNPLQTVESFFTWDACTCVVTASLRLEHMKTSKRVVFNCGIGEGSGHFEADEVRFRAPPFNMISPDEVWAVFDHA